MHYEALENRLSLYGLEPREAKLYVVITRKGPQKAGELSRLCGLSRMDTYRVLQRLQAKGLVEVALRRPMKFSAVPPERALDLLIKAVREKVELMEGEKKAFLTLWASLPKEDFPAEGERFRVVQGRTEFFSTLKSLFETAGKSVYIFTTRNGISRLYHGGVDEHLKARSKEIRVRVLAEVDRANIEAVEGFASLFTLRHIPRPTGAQFVIIDGSEVVVSMLLDDSTSLSSERDTSLWTNSRSYIGMMERLFEEFWNDSVDARSAIESAVHGTVLPETRIVRGESGIVEKELEIISSAKEGLILLATPAGVPALLQGPISRALGSTKEKGVATLVMAPWDEKNIEVLSQLAEKHELRLIDFDPTTETLSADGGRMVLVRSAAGRDLKEEASAFWTNEAGYTTTMQHFLEQVWVNADEPGPIFRKAAAAKGLGRMLVEAAAELDKAGFTVDTPGVLRGSSSVEHSFRLVGRGGPRGATITIDYALDSAPIGVEPIIAYGAKRSDCRPDRSLLLVIPGTEEQAQRLAAFFGIEVLQDDSVQGLDRKLREEMKRLTA